MMAIAIRFGAVILIRRCASFPFIIPVVPLDRHPGTVPFIDDESESLYS